MTVTVLCAAQAAGVIADPRVAEHKSRLEFSSAVAVAISNELSDSSRWSRRRPDPDRLSGLLSALSNQHESLDAAAILSRDGVVVAEVGSKPTAWSLLDANEDLSENLVYVPILRRGEPFGQVQLRFGSATASRFGIAIPPLMRTFLFIAAAGFIVHLLFLRRMLRYLDPSRAVPDRVRTTLDTLAEGLVLLDGGGNVVLANTALTELLGIEADAMKGRPINRLRWLADGGELAESELPWTTAIERGEPVVGQSLQLAADPGQIGMLLRGEAIPEDAAPARTVTFLVNATPIDGDRPGERGALVSFDDITNLEEKKAQLADTLDAVRRSSEEIQRQNAELERLATHDALTGCVNRRRLFEDMEREWSASARHGYPVSCILADVDHFKRVNDTHGHGVGDDVLVRVGTALRETARESDLVSRYGGEEFCVLLPQTDLEQAHQAAERLRHRIETLAFPNLRITASFGVSAIGYGSDDPQELIDQADRCLYEAKHRGRNCVVDVTEVDLTKPMPSQASESERPAAPGSRIPFHAVTALISALAYRDRQTASHCRRVADLAVATAEGLLSPSDCYTLEIAALLHDLGKIGVPDSILLKAGPLTEDEWGVMRRHDKIGIEIVRASFACPALTDILSHSRVRFAETAEQSISARILAVADAFDSMVTEQPYRPGRTVAEAVAELRRCSEPGVGQFDAEIVERFVSVVRTNRSEPSLSVDKESALSIGMQIEHLADALEEQDLERLAAMAIRVQQVAEQYGVAPVAEQADLLNQAVTGSNQDLLSILQSAGDLLTLCRSTQTTYVEELDEETSRETRLLTPDETVMSLSM